MIIKQYYITAETNLESPKYLKNTLECNSPSFASIPKERLVAVSVDHRSTMCSTARGKAGARLAEPRIRWTGRELEGRAGF